MTDLNYEKYYEKLHYKKRDLTKLEEMRIKDTIHLLPSNICSLLEVGCGDGRIINQLVGKYDQICGLDISNNALKHVKTPKVQGSIEKLPFPDNSFDIIVCCEVLEHLPFSIYQKSLKEIERVSKKYILISVPNNENLELNMVKCPRCGCFFNQWRHLRSFNQNNLKGLFEDYYIYKIHYSLFEYDSLPYSLIKAIRFFRNFLKKNNSELPKYALCPQCGFSSSTHETKSKQHDHDQKSLIWFLKRLFFVKKKSGWILVLYKRFSD